MIHRNCFGSFKLSVNYPKPSGKLRSLCNNFSMMKANSRNYRTMIWHWQDSFSAVLKESFHCFIKPPLRSWGTPDSDSSVTIIASWDPSPVPYYHLAPSSVLPSRSLHSNDSWKHARTDNLRHIIVKVKALVRQAPYHTTPGIIMMSYAFSDALVC